MSDFAQVVVFTDQPEGGVSAKKLNISWRDNTIAPAFVSAKPQVAGVTTGDFLLVLRANGTYAKVPATAVGSGATGARGSLWYTGAGAPGTIAGQQAQDQYLNTSNGDVYTYQ